MSDARSEIVETTTRMAVFADQRRWDELVAEVFAGNVHLDYSALNGNEPGTFGARDVAAGWERGLAHVTTQHLVTNHLVAVSGDRADVTASFQATHVRSGTEPWVLGGDYRYQLVRTTGGWRISAVTLYPRWETGDRSILDA